MDQIKPFVLAILDGWGQSPAWGGNAITMAQTPNMDRCWAKFPHTTLKASGGAVGLPGHEMGNSEVGHLNLGAGRVIWQDISRISKTIKSGSFFKNKVLKKTCQFVLDKNSSLHIVGLASDGGVHSHINHLTALLELAKKEKVKSVFVHVLCDGRDTDPSAALSYVSKLKEKMKVLGVGRIATVSGRYYAMDRDKRWDRTEKVYNAMVLGEGPTAKDALSCISHSYAEGKTDEFITPTVIISNNKPIAKIKNNDAVIFFNFRADRMRQLTHAFADKKFRNFKRRALPKNLNLVTMVPYEYEIEIPVKVIFPIPKKIKNVLTEIISDHNLKQLHIAETEKYAHVTYFFNGGREKPFPGEDRILVPSPRVATYDLKPEMSADGVYKKLIANLTKYDFIVVNFANPDMVGHTGNMKAAIRAVETVDRYIGQIAEEIKKQKGLMIITADHGNVEKMIDPVTGERDTEHSTSEVPFIIIDGERSFRNLHPGKLANVAPTILDIMGIEKPAEMDESTLFEIQNHKDQSQKEESAEEKPTL